jgi:hypothetical protein
MGSLVPHSERAETWTGESGANPTGVAMPRWLRAPRRGQGKCAPTLLIGFGLALVYGVSHPPAALAQGVTATTCPQSGGAGGTITCSAPNTYNSGTNGNTAPTSAGPNQVVPAAGNGQSTNAGTITVQPGATIQSTNLTSLSAGNGETINISGTVTTTTNSGTNLNGSKYSGTGPNTVEAGANNAITVFSGATVRAQGNTTGTFNGNPRSEAINVMGFGNVITVNAGGTLFSNTSSAIFLQNDPSLISPSISGGGIPI